MLSSDFSALLDREIERGISESRMFRILFEMGYRSTVEYGEDYAVGRTLDSILNNVERDGSHDLVSRKRTSGRGGKLQGCSQGDKRLVL